MLVAFALRFAGSFPQENLNAYLVAAPGLTVISVALFLTYGLYDFRSQSWRAVSSGVIAAVTLLPALTMALSFVVRAFALPRTVIVLSWLLHLVLLATWRRFVWGHLRRMWGGQTAWVVGPQGEAAGLARDLGADRLGNMGYLIGAVVVTAETAESLQPSTTNAAAPNLPLETLLSCLAASTDPSPCRLPDVIILTPSTTSDVKARVVADASMAGIPVLLIPGHPELLTLDSRMTQINHTLAFEVGASGAPPHLAWAKRLLDLLVSTVGLAMTLPLYPLIALAIRLGSHGPVFYRQRRVGLGGATYILLKFRTMQDNAEASTGPVLAERDDPRVTAVGRFLRRYRLDELPQLLNVFCGTMSLVGPRPERPEFVQRYARELPYYSHRHLLKPGLTGLAQLHAGYDTPVEEKLRYDLLYAKRYSLLLDLRILFLTARTMLRGDEAHWADDAAATRGPGGGHANGGRKAQP